MNIVMKKLKPILIKMFQRGNFIKNKSRMEKRFGEMEQTILETAQKIELSKQEFHGIFEERGMIYSFVIV